MRRRVILQLFARAGVRHRPFQLRKHGASAGLAHKQQREITMSFITDLLEKRVCLRKPTETADKPWFSRD
jgi:hypothetical protein